MDVAVAEQRSIPADTGATEPAVLFSMPGEYAISQSKDR